MSRLMTAVLTDCWVSAPRLRAPVYVMELADLVIIIIIIIGIIIPIIIHDLVRPPGAADIEDRS